MKASVIVPVYNGEKAIREVVDALLGQGLSHKEYEVIVVDDGSTDGTLEVLKNYGRSIRIVKAGKNGGPGRARNLGIRAARGNILAFTDADCVPDKNWLENGLAHFADDVVAVSGRTYTEKEKKSYLTHYSDNENDNRLYPTCNMFYTREALEKVGGFMETIPVPFFEDTDIAWRVQKEFPGKRIEFAKDAGVFHPCLPASLRRIIRIEAEFREYDPLVYRRNPELFRQKFLLFWRMKKSSMFLAVPLSLLACLAVAPVLLPIWLLAYLAYVAFYFRARDWRLEPKSTIAAVLTIWMMPLLKEFYLLKGAMKYKTLLF
ncbi:MAG: glycosyltransferase family A protein [Candidatus Micrarchaeia archaeon]|jgi:hypothetical protein